VAARRASAGAADGVGLNAMLADLPFLPIAELARQLRAGETTSVVLVDACLANIDAQDGKLHAFVDVWRDAARRLARAADAEREAGFARGPLHGMPIAVKDLFHVAGRVTTAGSASRRDNVSSHTATCVQRLLDAGMIPLGKTHMVEFAYGTWGTNRPMGTPWNPWDLATHRVPGGSSSGSGVAVAAGMAPAALGTDTGGSVRIPAALCGLVGFKPTYGRIPLDGVVPLATSLDSVGPLARTVEDAQRLVAAMAGEPCDPAPPADRLDGVRITALAPDAFPDIVERVVAAAFARMVARLRERGAVVREERIPFDFPALGARNGRLIGIEGYAAHREVIDDAAADVDPGVRDRMLLARSATAAEYLDALARRREAMAAFDDWMRGRDALATPMLPITARAVDAVDETTYPLATWSRAVNYLGACAISVPAPWDGPLPVGLQLVGRAGHDDEVARIAAAAVDGDPLPRPPAPTP
jgi:aspartyl-tRNA(Asn)/glutamyl-tRNA(Gln) amidotransferase subunit A